MNREQQRYFVKRVEEIKAAKIFKIRKETAARLETIPSVESRVLAQLVKHKKEATEQIFDAIKHALENCDQVRTIEFYCTAEPWGTEELNVALPFATSAQEQYIKEKKAIEEESSRLIEEVNAEAKKLIDQAMFCQLPSEFASMLEQFEKSEQLG